MGTPGPTVPPPGLVELHAWQVGEPAQLRTLRASLFEAVTGEVMAAQFTLGGVADRMVLVATEFTGHMLTHGQPPAEIRLSRTEHDFVVEVSDHDGRVSDFTWEDAPDSGRLWLRMAQRLSSEVGWYKTGSISHLWARFEDDAPVEVP